MTTDFFFFFRNIKWPVFVNDTAWIYLIFDWDFFKMLVSVGICLALFSAHWQ